jgi:hypothetical protein
VGVEKGVTVPVSLSLLSQVRWEKLRSEHGDPKRIPELFRSVATTSAEALVPRPGAPGKEVFEFRSAWTELMQFAYDGPCLSVNECTIEMCPFIFALLLLSRGHRMLALEGILGLCEETTNNPRPLPVHVRAQLAKGIPEVIGFLHDNSPSVRGLSAAILGRLSEHPEVSYAAIAAALATESEPEVSAVETWALWMLGNRDRETFERLYQGAVDVLPRAVAASLLISQAARDVKDEWVHAVAAGELMEQQDLWLPHGLFEAALHQCPLGGHVLQQIRTGRYKSTT